MNGTLIISIIGLPNTLTAKLTVSGPSGIILEENLTGGSNVALNVVPGSYNLQPFKVNSQPGVTYQPEQEKYQVWLNQGQTLTQIIHYAIQPTIVPSYLGTLILNIAGLPNTLIAQVNVTYPNGGVNANIAGGTSIILKGLLPGNYLVQPSKVINHTYYLPEQEKYQVGLAPGQTLTQTIHYIGQSNAHTSNDLIISIVGLPNNLTAQVNVTSPYTSTTSIANISGGTNNVLGGLPPGNYALHPLDVGLWKPEQVNYQVRLTPYPPVTQNIVYKQT